MSTFRRLSRLGGTVKEPAVPAWKAVAGQFERGLQWLTLRPQVQAALFSVGMGFVAILLLIFSSVTAAVAALAAWIALMRHFAQTNADRQRRITESFAKAVEQLGSEKIEIRLGGIYSLERISKESPDDYWTVMEILTAFVRERSRRNEAERTSQDVEQRVSRRAYFLWREAGRPEGRPEEFWARAVRRDEFGDPPGTDIAAVLAVIKRRSKWSRKREGDSGWRFDFSQAILKNTDLREVHLEGANLSGAHFEGTDLSVVDGLSEAQLAHAHGDARTQLDDRLVRPAHWPPPALPNEGMGCAMPATGAGMSDV